MYHIFRFHITLAFVWLTSLSTIVSGSIHVAAKGITLFFFMAQLYSIVYMCHIVFIHSSVNGHLGCFHVLAIVNSAAMNTACSCIFLNYGFLWMYAQEWKEKNKFCFNRDDRGRTLQIQTKVMWPLIHTSHKSRLVIWKLYF